MVAPFGIRCIAWCVIQ